MHPRGSQDPDNLLRYDGITLLAKTMRIQRPALSSHVCPCVNLAGSLLRTAICMHALDNPFHFETYFVRAKKYRVEGPNLSIFAAIDVFPDYSGIP